MAKHGIVIIEDSQGNKITNKDLVLESDISLGISNTYESLLSGGGSTALSSISSLVGGGLISAGFKQQGFQVWKSTNPIELKLSVSLHMITSGKLDVIKPVERLMAYSVPKLAENGWGLIPPGANILAILGDKGIELGENYSFLQEAKGWVSIKVENYLRLDKCIIRNAIPTYSLQVDSEGYAISCKLDIDLVTLEIANDQIINNLSSQGV